MTSTGGTHTRPGDPQAGATETRVVRSLRLDRRLHVPASVQIGALVVALAASFVVTALLIASAGADVTTALRAMVRGAFGSRAAVIETLVQATPLIFTSLAVTVAFRGGLWNIGAEGQFFAGAMAAFWIGSRLPEDPVSVVVFAMYAGGAVAAAAWGSIAGFLKARYGASEIIVTVMMNFIMAYLLSFLLGGAWQEQGGHFYQTDVMPDSSYIPRLVAGGRLHVGFILALLTAVGVYVLLWKTTLGYEIRAIGSNSEAARSKGINVPLTMVLVMALSAAVAGLGGAGELAGIHHRLRLDISTGYGFTGIIIALLGRLHPAGAVITAIFFGALINGALAMQIATGVPVAVAAAIQGITLIFLLTADVLARYRIRIVRSNA